MEYYARPDGIKRMLKSRIRRCYTALADLQSAVEYLYTHRDHLSEHYAVEDAEHMYEMSHEAAHGLTDLAQLSTVDTTVGIERAQEQLLTSPSAAKGIRRSVEHVHDDAKTVRQNIEYQRDASHFTSTDDSYQALREKVIPVFGLVDVIMDAIDDGFITGVAVYSATDR